MKKHILLATLLIVVLSLKLYSQDKNEGGFIQSDTIRQGKSVQLVAIPIVF